MLEIKKNIINNKGFIVFIFGILLWISCLNITGTNQYTDQGYYLYLEEIIGQYDNHKADYIEKEAVSIANAKAKKELIMDEYFSGKMDPDDYNQEMKKINNILKYNSGFEKIYEQYLYICEDDNNRYFMDQAGWQNFFSNKLFAIFASVMILVITAQVLCKDYHVQMDILCRTCKSNKKNLYTKIFYSILSSVIICITLTLIQYLYNIRMYGLCNGNFPIQSIPYFKTSTKNISCNQAVFYITLIRISGAILYSNLILAISSFTRKLSFTVCIVSALQLVPVFGFSNSWMYSFPFPVSFFTAEKFIQGSVFEKDAVTNTNVITFEEIKMFHVIILLIISYMLSILFIAVLIKVETNCWEKFCVFKKKLFSITRNIIVIVLITLLLNGCSSNRYINTATNLSFNIKNGSCFENNNIKIYFENMGDYPIVLNKKNQTKDNLILDPFLQVNNKIQIPMEIYYTDKYLYYVRIDREDYLRKVGKNNNRLEKVSIIEVDLSNFEEHTIFEQTASTGRQFIGIHYEVENIWNFLLTHKNFFLNDKEIFFVCDNEIYMVNRKSKKINKIEINTNKNIAFYKNDIYYISDDSFIYKYQINKGERKQILKTGAYNFLLNKKQIYFINREDENKVYKYDMDTSELKKVSSMPADDIKLENNKLIILNKEIIKEIMLP